MERDEADAPWNQEDTNYKPCKECEGEKTFHSCCGDEISEETLNCPSCGRGIVPEDTCCPECGGRGHNYEEQDDEPIDFR